MNNPIQLEPGNKSGNGQQEQHRHDDEPFSAAALTNLRRRFVNSGFVARRSRKLSVVGMDDPRPFNCFHAFLMTPTVSASGKPSWQLLCGAAAAEWAGPLHGRLRLIYAAKSYGKLISYGGSRFCLPSRGGTTPGQVDREGALAAPAPAANPPPDPSTCTER